MKTLHLDEIEGVPVFGTLVWKPVRKTLGVSAFGINAYTAASAGDEVVERHDETQLGHEEIYAVVAGHATFTVDGEDVDAPAGTLVYLDDPAQTRHAVAKVAGTTVLAIGGVPGTHESSPWEYFFPALPAMREGDYDTAKRIIRDGLEAKPGDAALLYNLACVEALAGDHDAALEHLNAAVDARPGYLEGARDDEDFAAIRDDPRFPAA
ncbi:MAG TPA: tetratricopeptide repeat protein [Gaiellaceae bacterium]|nr:tetratricopeptide repeat protein [Gaiellaceae bacterium]